MDDGKIGIQPAPEHEWTILPDRRGFLTPFKPVGGTYADYTTMSDELARRVLEMCKHRGWSLHWTARGAYLHLEASELIEAVRGKNGTPLEEAGDVLLVLMSITEHQGIPWHEIVEQTSKKCESLMTKPPYPGEEREGLSSKRAIRGLE